MGGKLSSMRESQKEEKQEKEGSEKEESQDAQDKEEQDKRLAEAKKKQYLLFKSPAQRLDVALRMAKVPFLLKVLGPVAIDCHRQPSGHFALSLSREVSVEKDGNVLTFGTYVTGRATHKGLVGLKGVSLVGEKGTGAVEGLSSPGQTILEATLRGGKKAVKLGGAPTKEAKASPKPVEEEEAQPA